MTTSGDLFDRRWAVRLSVLAVLSLALTLGFSLLSEAPVEQVTAEANSFSVSALGHQALVEFLKQAGVGVLVSRHGSLAKADQDVPLLLLEPALAGPGAAAAEEMVVAARAECQPVLVVLPKWHGEADRSRPWWVKKAKLHAPAEVEAQLQAWFGEDAPVLVRVGKPAAEGWQPALELPAPELPDAQLLRLPADTFEVLLGHSEGALLVRRGSLYLLADPDVLNNSGLGRGDNAVLMHRLLVDHLQARALVLDETLHGFGRQPSIWRELGRFPLRLLTLHLGLLLLALLWVASQRLGAPRPMPPRLVRGQRGLIESAAQLLAAGGHQGHALHQYLQLVLRRLTAACALPAGLDVRQQVMRLVQLGRARGVKQDLAVLVRRARVLGDKPRPEPRQVLDLCRALHLWRREMTDGPA